MLHERDIKKAANLIADHEKKIGYFADLNERHDALKPSDIPASLHHELIAAISRGWGAGAFYLNAYRSGEL